MKVYLFGYFEDYKSVNEFLSNIELIPENKLVEKVKGLIDEECICPETIDRVDYDLDHMTPEMAIQILENDGYTVREYEL